MQKYLAILLIVLLTACQTVDPLAKPKQDPCPLTHLDTRKQQQMCEHYAGENPYDKERAEFLDRKMKELNCELYL